MAIRIASTKRLESEKQLYANEAAAAAVKGYYDRENQLNEYFKRIEGMFRGVKLPAFNRISREEIKRAYEQMAPVNGVIDYIADNVGEVMKYLELRTTDRDGNYKYHEDHWLMAALRRPNDRYNLQRFGKAWAVNRLLFDDAWTYAPLTKGKDRKIDPKVGMHVIPSHLISVESKGLIAPMYGVKILGTGGDAIEADGKIFESFGYSLDAGSFFGTSKIIAAAVYLSVLEKGMLREDHALDNGGPVNIITPTRDTMGVLPQDADSIEREFNDGKAANRTKALRTPIDVHQLGSNPVDLNILASHKEAVTALCFVYHLPVDLYYGQAKYENAKEAKKTIYEQQAIPLAEEFAADLLSYTRLDEEGYELVANRDEIDALQEGPTSTLDRLTKMHASLNELRTANGYDKIDEDYADKPILPMGIQFGNEFYDINEI